MAAKIGYRVIFTTSNETGHDGQELEIRNNIDSPENNKSKNKGKGWQSARFCDYPQELVLSLDNICEITQIQILSHQSKIASKIEIWVGLDSVNKYHDYSTYKSLNWKRLGYLSLDKNERSNWKARELKSVYINTIANYIKFSLHESHINTINLFNQVGIVALTILGKITNHLQQNQLINNTQNNQNKSNNNIQPFESRNPSIEFDAEIDDNTAKKIRELMLLKKQAVDREDYDEAKRCKLCIENLKNSAKQLFNLENEKKIAVQKEDYDTAKQLKLQIERLRQMSLNINNNNTNIQPPPQQIVSFANPSFPPQPQQPQQPQQQPMHSQQSPYSRQGSFNQPPPVQTAMMNNMQSPNSVHFTPTQQQQQQAPIAMNMNNMNHMSHGSHSHSQSMSPSHYNPNPQMNKHPDERQIRPMKRNLNTMDINNVNPFGDHTASSQSPNQQVQVEQVKQAPLIQEQPSESQSQSQAQGQVNGDGNGPPPLKPSVKKGSEKLIEMFGEYTICLLNSSNWNHRDEGLKAIISFLKKKEHPDTRQVFKLAAKIIYSGLQDRVAGVVLTGIDALNTLMNVYANDMDHNEIGKCIHSIIIILVNILGHSNNRLIDSAGSILISLCHHDEILCKSIYNVLIKKMKKILPKHLKGRGLILLQLIPQFNVPKGCDMNSLMDNLVKPQLLNKNGEVRDVGVQIVTLLYQINECRHKLIQYLEHANLNDFIKETLNNSFQDATGHTNVLEREPKSIKEQSRPSKAMSRTNNNGASHTKKSSIMNDKKKSNAAKRRKANRGRGRGRGARGNNNNRGGGGGGGGRSVQNENSKPMQNNQNHGNNVDDEEEQEDVCNFCDLRDVSFLENEENLDLHYWQSCPMLTSCKLCEQVIEIATLHEHILTECESGIKHELCNKCNVPYPIQEIQPHRNRCNEKNNGDTKCSLCLENIGSSPDCWKLHLLKYPGCKSNPRPLLQ